MHKQWAGFIYESLTQSLSGFPTPRWEFHPQVRFFSDLNWTGWAGGAARDTQIIQVWYAKQLLTHKLMPPFCKEMLLRAYETKGFAVPGNTCHDSEHLLGGGHQPWVTPMKQSISGLPGHASNALPRTWRLTDERVLRRLAALA